MLYVNIKLQKYFRNIKNFVVIRNNDKSGVLRLKSINRGFVFKAVKWIAAIYLMYFFTFGIIIFNFNNDRDFETPFNISMIESSNDEVLLLEEPINALRHRISLIRQAATSIDIACFSLSNDHSSRIIVLEILKAADRGVEISAIFDGIMHGFRGDKKGALHLLVKHPNIRVSFYEPFSITKPWVIQNRLHDKYLIVDNQYVIVGGRNIGDRYFIPGFSSDFTYDRDILVKRNSSESVIDDISLYFSSLWNFKGSKELLYNSNYIQDKVVDKYLESTVESIALIEKKYPVIFESTCHSKFHEVDSIKLIHNPLQRFNKEPWVLHEINELLKKENEPVLIKTPYIILTNRMLKEFDVINELEVEVITNSREISPNLFAIAGYLNNKGKIVDNISPIHKYNGEGALHGKSLLVGDLITVIGTYNFDPRSTFLSTESMLIIESRELNEDIRFYANKHKLDSVDVKDMDYEGIPIAKRLVIFILRILLYPFTNML